MRFRISFLTQSGRLMASFEPVRASHLKVMSSTNPVRSKKPDSSIAEPSFPIDDASGRGVEELVAALDDPNGVRRDLAHQLLVHRGDPRAAASLKSLARDGVLAVARLHLTLPVDERTGLGLQVQLDSLQRLEGRWVGGRHDNPSPSRGLDPPYAESTTQIDHLNDLAT